MNKPIKVVFILPTLHSGGAEKIMSFVAQHINRDLFDTTLIITGSKTEDDYKVETINVIYFNSDRVIKAIPKIYKYLKKNKPQIAVSSIIHLNVVMGFLSIFLPNTKFIARESSVIGQQNLFGHNFKDRILNKLVKYAYRNLDCIICQSQDMKNDLHVTYNISDNKLVIINNPITKQIEVNPSLNPSHDKLKFITIGRLDRIKGYPRLLKILSKLNYDFEYTIIGKGDSEELLETVKLFGLEEKVNYIEYTDNVYKYFNEHDLFLQGSYVEGFPNALLENCITGTPAIVFNAPGGTKEIIEHGINGLIAENEEQFLVYLNNFKKNDFNPKVVAGCVIKKFNKETIIGLYETLFTTLLNKNN